jgi:hypothetical protein
MIVIVLRSSRTCHNMNVRPGSSLNSLIQAFTVYPKTMSIPGLSGDVPATTQKHVILTPPRGGRKTVILTLFWGGGAILNNVNFGGFHRS